MGNNVNMKKYDISGTSGKAPSTKVIPGSHGRTKGGLAKALKRKKEMEALLKKTY